MRTLHVERRPLDCAALGGRIPSSADYSRLLTESTTLVEAGRPTVVYEELDWDTAELARALVRIKASEHHRTNGLKTVSRTFGFLSRNVIRSDYCTAAGLAQEMPREHAVVCSFAERVAERYREARPDLFAEHATRATGSVVADYRIGGSPFTSGNINKNDALAYHFDKGNFPGVWSCMLVFKRSVEGGYLACPEYDLAFELKHNSLLMFDGQGLLHGVTPVRKVAPGAYRISVVYYSLKQMWQCLPFKDEVQRIREAKTRRERALKGRNSYVGVKPEIRKRLSGGKP